MPPIDDAPPGTIALSPRPRRVLILNSCRKWIGEAAHCYDLARLLAARGHRAILVCRRGYALEDAARRGGLAFASLEFSSRFSPRLDWRDLRRLRALAREEAIEILHCHRGKDHWLAACMRELLRPRPVLVRTRHVVTAARNHALNRWLYGRATAALISVSRGAHEGLGALVRAIPSGRGRVILSAVDQDRFSPRRRDMELRRSLGVADGDLLVGLVGRLQNIKGHHVFIRAAGLAAQSRPNARFLAAGLGPTHKVRRQRALADELGLGKRYILLGHRDDLPALMAGFDVGVAASLGSEGSSRVSLEYMASGVPVVATRVGGIPELLRQGEFGRLVDPGDAEQLAEAIGALLDSTEERQRLAQAARRMVAREHSFERWIADVEGVYESALAEGAKGRAR
ncbi:MAG: Spore coat protein SA [candidate division BRC1 bacterium ADurb.BinA364]|nr:MAG: Spore coat protein SA [candidate division BRC1 bacterium ADurb.BinA364]